MQWMEGVRKWWKGKVERKEEPENKLALSVAIQVAVVAYKLHAEYSMIDEMNS